MLDELIKEVEEVKDIRLMCHCMDTREGTVGSREHGSMTCHLEPVAEYIEVMAKAVRERKGYGRGEEAQGSKEKERRAEGGKETGEQAEERAAKRGKHGGRGGHSKKRQAKRMRGGEGRGEGGNNGDTQQQKRDTA